MGSNDEWVEDWAMAIAITISIEIPNKLDHFLVEEYEKDIKPCTKIR